MSGLHPLGISGLPVAFLFQQMCRFSLRRLLWCFQYKYRRYWQVHDIDNCSIG